MNENNDFFEKLELELANGQIDASQNVKHLRKKIKKILKRISFDPEHVGTEYLITLISDLYYIHSFIGKDIFDNIDYIEQINPLYNLNSDGSFIYDVVSYFNEYDRNYMVYMLNDTKNKSTLNYISFNQLVYPIINELVKRDEEKYERSKTELFEKFGHKNRS